MCGKKHWSRVCYGDDVTPVTKPIVTPVTVTKPSVTVCAECEALRAEVVILKRKLAEAHGGRKPVGDAALSAADRMRKMRAKRQTP
jgi:hypothetical protein